MQMLAELSWGQWFVAMLIIVICAFLMLVILLQRGRGGGLAGAFGGAGGSSAFGSKTGDVFTWITVVVAAAFLIVCVIGGFVFQPETEAQTPAPAAGTDAIPVTAPPAGTTTTSAPETVPGGDTPAPKATPPDAGTAPDTPPATGDTAAGSEEPTGKAPAAPQTDEAGGSGEEE